MSYFVYMLESRLDGSHYTGQSNNIPRRLKKHNKGLVKSTKAKRPYTLVYFEEFPTRSQAMWREWELKKKWNTERKKRLILSFDKSKILRLFEGGTPDISGA